MHKVFLSLLFLILYLSVTAQPCACPEYEGFYANPNPPEVEKFYRQLRQSKNQYCFAKFLEWKANRCTSMGKVDSTELLLAKADKIYSNVNCPSTERINYYKYWAGLLYSKGDFKGSLEWSFKFLKAAEASNKVYEVAVCNTMIAQLFNQMGQANHGIFYTRKAVSLLNKIQGVQKQEEILYKISKRYLWHYQDFNIKSSLDSCELFGGQHLRLAKQLGISSKISLGYNNLQGIAFEKKDFGLCLQYLDSASLYIDQHDIDNTAINYFDRADILLQLKDFKEAERFADSALANYKKADIPAYVADTYGLISEIHRQAGNYEKALNSFILQNEITDSLTSAEKSTAFNELEKKYNQEKNEREIKDLIQQRTIYLLLTLSLLLTAFGGFIFFRKKSLRQKQLILETEQRLNRARMNPHFFFNTLSSLQQIALDERDSLKLASSLSRFSQVMRRSLESTYQDLVSIEEEIDFLKQYVQVQQVRFLEAFTFEITSSDLELNEVVLPSMLVQPFVENSIEHGLTGLDYKGAISIGFSKRINELVIEIKDNGRGIRGESSKKDHISRATEITKDRFYLLNINTKSNAHFEVENGDRGVTVYLYLPLMSR